MSRPLTKKKAQYRAAVGRELATLYSPITEALAPTRTPSRPSPADTLDRLERLKYQIECVDIALALRTLNSLIDDYKT